MKPEHALELPSAADLVFSSYADARKRLFELPLNDARLELVVPSQLATEALLFTLVDDVSVVLNKDYEMDEWSLRRRGWKCSKKEEYVVREVWSPGA